MITSGATLNVKIDPWANRGKPTEIVIEGDDTFGALKAFLQSVQRRDPNTLCPVSVGLENTATLLMADESLCEGRVIGYPL